jgi:hypothetical protein
MSLHRSGATDLAHRYDLDVDARFDQQLFNVAIGQPAPQVPAP